jgi:hypothetical protein
VSLNIAALPADVAAEVGALQTVVAAIQKAVADAKSQGLTSVTISDIEAVLPAAQTVVTDTEKLVGDV